MIDRSKQYACLGFTLVELLVVLTILALLAVLLIPALSGIRHVASMTVCANNLKRIGEAARHLESEERTDRRELNAMQWQMQLAPFLHDSKIFICTEDDPDADSAKMPLSEIVAIHGWATYNPDDYIQSLVVGTFICKLSNTQYLQAGFGDGKRSYSPPAYQADSKPEVFWFCMEDWQYAGARGDFDWDLHIRATDNFDGTVTLLLKQMGTGYQFELIDLLKNEAVMNKGQMTGVAPGAEYTVTVGGQGLTSYGINGAVGSILDSVGKILVIEYPWLIARSTHDWSDFDSDIPGIPIFARHYGKMNVLFTDGSVSLKRPDEVNPSDPRVQTTLWDD